MRADSVYPRLRPGDAVTVFATRDRGKPTAQTVTLLARATIYAVTSESSSTTVSSTGGDDRDVRRRVINVTLVVPHAEAEAFAHAAVTHDLTVALLSGVRGAP